MIKNRKEGGNILASKKLEALFDFQKFVGNEKLEKVISDMEKQKIRPLSDEDLEEVSAAGTAEQPGSRTFKKTSKKHK